MKMQTALALYENDAQYDQEFEQNLNECRKQFSATFKHENSEVIAVCAPGRVNLIGEHVDYCDGFVFPMAIPLYTIIVGCKNNDANKICRIKSLETSLSDNSLTEFSLNELRPKDKPYNWANYVIGVCANFDQNFIESFDAVIKSNVPLGSGLSSSAALEVATYTFLENLTNHFVEKKQKALACQKAEHDFASVPCGIMDQFISAMGLKSNALLIDCRSYEGIPFALNDPDVSFLVTNSNVKHSLEGSEYSSRRAQCEQAAKILNKSSLRDANLKSLIEKKGSFDDLTFKRARHVIGEISRTLEASEALKANNMSLFGKLMNASHDSLRDDFEVSCAELDQLVEIARKTNGVLGSRMTGGGFGGCTVTLVRNEHTQELIKNIQNNYNGKPSFYVCKPCQGARRV